VVEKQNRRTGLARAISKLGYCSRSHAVELVCAGRVRLKGTVCRDPEMPVHLGKDAITIDGQKLVPPTKIYLMLNKPRGLVTTASDEKGHNTVYAALSRDLAWVAPVGRLDKASEGLLLFTNDSAWAARITAPETRLEKTYHVQVNVMADESLVNSLALGLRSKDGDLLRVKRVTILRHGERNSWLEILLDEGKNRHIRRMLAEFGIEVLRLVRVAIGPLILGDLPKGATRPLTTQEKQQLDRAMQQSHKRSL